MNNSYLKHFSAILLLVALQSVHADDQDGPGVNIDASDAAGSLLGHSYFAEDRRIMEDIFGLLQTGQRADNRFGLEARETAQGRYWTFRK
jgi:hypothetical protein